MRTVLNVLRKIFFFITMGILVFCTFDEICRRDVSFFPAKLILVGIILFGLVSIVFNFVIPGDAINWQRFLCYVLVCVGYGFFLYLVQEKEYVGYIIWLVITGLCDGIMFSILI